MRRRTKQMKAIVWMLRALFVLALAVALFGGVLGFGWVRVGFISALALLLVLLVLRWVDLARRKRSPEFL